MLPQRAFALLHARQSLVEQWAVHVLGQEADDRGDKMLLMTVASVFVVQRGHARVVQRGRACGCVTERARRC